MHFAGDREALAGNTVREWLVEDKPFNDVVKQVEGTNIYFIPSDEKVEGIPYELQEIGVTGLDLKNAIMEKIEPLREVFDVIFFDTHPSENDKNSLMALTATRDNGVVLIPMLVELESIVATKRMARLCESEGVRYMVVPMKIKTGFFGKQQKRVDEVKQEFLDEGFKGEFSGSIRESSVIPDLAMRRVDYDEMKKNKYAARVIDDYKELLKLIEGGLPV
jgi:cellulose biosynthesis protein BcsQ